MSKAKVDKNLTKQVRIEVGLHSVLKIQAARKKTSIKALIEGWIAEGLSTEKEN